MSRRTKVNHPMAGSRKSVAEKASANLKGATEKMQELMDAESKGKKKVRDFAPEELGDLKDLIFLGKVNTFVEIGGYKFEVATLTNSEKREVIKILAGKGKQMAAYVQTCTLAMAIKTINGTPLYEAYKPKGHEEMSDYEICVAFVDTWQSGLVNRLFNEYEKINDHASNIFSNDSEAEDKLKK